MAGARPPDRRGVRLAGAAGVRLRPLTGRVARDERLEQRSVLAAEPRRLAVRPAGAVRRSDLGDPDRVLPARLARSGAARRADARPPGWATAAAGAGGAVRGPKSS